MKFEDLKVGQIIVQDNIFEAKVLKVFKNNRIQVEIIKNADIFMDVNCFEMLVGKKYIIDFAWRFLEVKTSQDVSPKSVEKLEKDVEEMQSKLDNMKKNLQEMKQKQVPELVLGKMYQIYVEDEDSFVDGVHINSGRVFCFVAIHDDLVRQFFLDNVDLLENPPKLIDTPEANEIGKAVLKFWNNYKS